MSHFTRHRRLLLQTIGTSLLTGCPWPQFFDLGWDEEVKLHSGRVIVVAMKYEYERLNGGFLNRYEPSILRDTTLTFDAGPPNGVTTQLFKGVRPALLDHESGRWYVVLNGGHYGTSRLIPGQDWGPGQNSVEQHIAMLGNEGFVPVPIRRLPEAFKIPNLLLQYAPTKELAAFNGTRITLVQKTQYLQKYPLGPGDMRIERPQESIFKPT